MDSRLGLPVNTVLDGSYRIERVVGSGGFGITYEAEDINLGTLVAIKEYYPFDFGDRDSTMSVKPKSDRHRQTFDWGRSNFLQEARTLARFEHPSIVRVTRVFEANSTAYMVMRFEQGYSFEAWLGSLGRLPTQAELDSIVAPMLDALQMMHAENFLHRDIAPDNIIVRNDGTPVLLDFGAARRAVAEMSRTMTGIVKAGYSPHEQYSSDSRLQGPWSDLYALGGTLYRAVTGHPPEEATLRVDEDHMPPAAQVARKSGYRPGFLSAIDACLKVRHSERPRSVAQLRPMMLGRKSQPKPGLERFVEAFKPSRPVQKTPSRPPSRPAQSNRTRRSGPSSSQAVAARRWPAIAAAVVAVLGGAYGGFEYTRWQPSEQVEAQRQAEAKRKADEAAAQRAQESRAAEERARQDAEAKLLADAAAARRKADEERARQEAEAKRIADAAAAEKRAADERARQEAETKRIADAAAAKRKADEERARQEAEAKRLADAAAAKKKADEERARQETEAKRLADAAAKKKADEERTRQEAEAKRLADAAAKKKADEERARQETEAKRIADAAAAKKKADEEAQAKREQEARIAAEKAAAADAARRKAEVKKSKTEDPGRVAAVTLNTQERAAFVKQVQELLKQSKCYDGAINGSVDDTQDGLKRFIASRKGKESPARIELAKATASDFDVWLRDAREIKDSVCITKEKPPKPDKPAVRQERAERASPPRTNNPPRYSSPPSGGGRIGPIQGIQ